MANDEGERRRQLQQITAAIICANALPIHVWIKMRPPATTALPVRGIACAVLASTVSSRVEQLLGPQQMRPFRCFISYSRSDLSVVESIDEILRNIGLIPIWDKDIPPGRPFGDEIRKRIAQSHVFMPLITGNSLRRPWVHQEIGYALGIDVPVVPIALGALPGEMLAGINAIRSANDLSNLRDEILRANLDELILPEMPQSELERLGVTVQIADYSDERTRALVDFASRIPCASHLRQRAFFSSFSLPDADPSNCAWDKIELTEKRSAYHRSLLRNERRILEKHARAIGGSLILYPYVDPGAVDIQVHLSQLLVLRAFLDSIPPDKITIALITGGFSGNLTIVGDWFGAKALPPQPGSEIR